MQLLAVGVKRRKGRVRTARAVKPPETGRGGVANRPRPFTHGVNRENLPYVNDRLLPQGFFLAIVRDTFEVEHEGVRDLEILFRVPAERYFLC